MKFWIIFFAVMMLFFGLIFWHGDNANKEYRSNNWTQEGIVLETYIAWGSNYSIINAENNKRYTLYCDSCIIGDTVEIAMNKSRDLRVIQIIPEVP